jgi:hypothetical protein
MADGEAAHVRLVDRRVRPGRRRRRVVAPVEGGIEELGELAAHAAGVRVEQQLAGIEQVAGLRREGAVRAVGVEQAGAGVRQVAVPDLVGPFGQRQAMQLALARRVEQAELDPARMRGEHGEVDARAVPGRAERIGEAGPELHPGTRSKKSVASGGRVRLSEQGRPCQEISSAEAPPPLPMSEPP